MNRRSKVRSKKIFILVSALMLMLVLCGCRTRITNNTEVIQTMEDVGMMQETYQIRRDELGIPIAETPLFKGWESSDDEYEDDDEYYEDFGTYEEEVYEDVEDEEVTDPNNRQDTAPVNRPPSQPVRRPVQVTADNVRVSFDANAKDAKCSPSFVMLKKGSTYGTLPVPTRSGYDFKGWYTAKKKGDKVTAKTKLKSDKAHTLYAHWEKGKKEDKEEDKKEEDKKPEDDKSSDPEPQPQPEPEPQPQEETKAYTITFDGNGGGDSVELSSSQMTIEENGTYGSMPSAKRNKYRFDGWFTDPSGGSQITGGTKFTVNADQTLYAHWTYEPYTWCDNTFTETANAVDLANAVRYIIYVPEGEPEDDEESFVMECKGSPADPDDIDNPPQYIIRFLRNYDKYEDAELDEKAAEIYAGYSESNPEVKVILISSKALTGNKEEKLLYKMKLFKQLYGSTDSIDEAIEELGGDDKGVYVYPKA